MKRIYVIIAFLVLVFAPFCANSQTQTDPDLINQINSTTDEVGIRGKSYNNKAAANMFKTIVDSKVSQFVKNRTVTVNDAIVQNDQNGIVVFNSATPITFTINQLTQATTVNVLNKGAGAVTFAPGAGVTITGVTLLSGGSFFSGVIYFDSQTSPIITTNEGSSVAGANRELQLNNAGIFGAAGITNNGTGTTTLGTAAGTQNLRSFGNALNISSQGGTTTVGDLSTTVTVGNGSNSINLSGANISISPSTVALYSGSHAFNSASLQVRNPAQTFSYSVIGSAIAANRNITLPLLTADDTYAFAGFAQTLTNKTLGAGTTISAIPTISAGIKLTMAPNATNTGFNLGTIAADPTTLVNGDMWYESTNHLVEARINGVTQALASLAGTQTLTNKTLGTGTTISAIPTISAGIKITTSPNATNAGFNFGSVTADPTTLVNGDVWYNSTNNVFRARQNAATGTFAVNPIVNNNELLASTATGAVQSSGALMSGGNLTLGLSTTASAIRIIDTNGSGTNESIMLRVRGAGSTVNATTSTSTDLSFNLTSTIGAWQTSILNTGTLVQIQPSGTGLPNVRISAGSSATNGGNLNLHGGIATNGLGGNLVLQGGVAVGGNNLGGTLAILSGIGTGTARNANIAIQLDPTARGTTLQGYLIISNIPTSSAGLPSGAVWSNAGVLTIVP